jgi:hypothetical protein
VTIATDPGRQDGRVLLDADGRELARFQRDAIGEPRQAVAVRRHRALLDALTALVEQAEIQPPAAQIQTSVQHTSGPPSRSLPWVTTPERATRRRPSFITFNAKGIRQRS